MQIPGLKQSDIKWLHVELSTRCNAWCPACGRNNLGFGLVDHLVEEDLNFDTLQQTLKKLPNLHTIQLCGNYGDPVIAKNITEVIELCKKFCKKIQIHTNGSLRNAEWWHYMAEQLKNIEHDVWFGIDGLSDTHHLYRQGTDFDKIINNATSFINNGGNAVWQFIPYQHNEHQIKDCIRLSQQLGFKKFKMATLHRTTTIVKHYKSGIAYTLSPPGSVSKLLKTLNNEQNTSTKIDDCMHYAYPSIYLGANGKFSTCCYQHKKTFDTIEELFYNRQDLTNIICIKNCGI
jgi:MoaA/NifB/PqqE/SkfB family radical SAM enzyme